MLIRSPWACPRSIRRPPRSRQAGSSWRGVGSITRVRFLIRSNIMKSTDPQASTENRDWREDPDLLFELIRKGMERGVREAIADHHRAGNPVAIWRDGQIVLLQPDGSVQPVYGEEPAPGETGDES